MKNIVAIDDSNVVLMTIQKILSVEYEIKAFSKELRALKYLKNHVPDLIILDIDMPEMDGFEMLEHIQEREELKSVPVIFLTSNNTKEHVMKALKGGAKDYILKPVKDDVLLEKVHAVLGEQKKGFSWDDV